MTYNKLFEDLFLKYYSNDQYSEVTSSHWRKYGEKTKVAKTSSGYEVGAHGISNFRNKSPLRSLKNIPVAFLISKLLARYKAENKTIETAKSITDELNIYFDFDHAKCVLIYDLLNSYNLFETKHIICIIGDGHGFLGTLIKKMCPEAKILFINLGRNLLIDALCFSKIFPELEHLHLQQPKNSYQLNGQSILFLETEQFENMQTLPISLFINIASMQEMDMKVIDSYFEYMRHSSEESHFYCLNREEKLLPDGSVTKFMDYPWGEEEILLDGQCPFYQKYPSSRPPFYHDFDGSHRHRLVKLK